ncbi:glycoside hydrolase family 3 protein [Pseudomaricurvus alcaniphilus]|uniref:glycoside hydrolase family 3 protein n=1 Tax=Pseudomaricurvus alcaniphilus TaxID=1166482 RepID=UPI0014083D44|nr:exo 1,3/1,4-beta-D-glucan glucohydrolase [Pseudomaricurvus alcaniphilus]NHN37183.1 glycoside hydrolase family 3 protein [Pseudomaricurvus alcaniphilus]
MKTLFPDLSKYCCLAVLTLAAATGCKPNSESAKSTAAENPAAGIWPVLDIEVKKDAAIESKVQSLLAQLTLEQKVAQMIQPEIRDISVEDMRKYGFGSYLNGGGAFPGNNKHASVNDWISLAEDMYQASVDDSLDGTSIPTMWGTDAVHGHNNVIGATLFPHNIGLGAANNPDLMEKIAQVTATEVMVTGIDWVFAPTVAVVRDDRWGRTYEGYSEDPEIVRDYAASIVKGLQGSADGDFLSANRVISTVKHFVGDGGTVDGDDQGNNVANEESLFKIHAQGYVGGLTAGAQSVMASFNSWNGSKVHGNKYLLTDVLKQRMGFDGFVVGDWNGHGQVKGCTNESCAQAVNAGLDIFMVPTDAWKPLYENTIAQVKQGIIPMERIDDAVTRILRVKFRAGLFDKASPANREYSGKTELIGHKSHRDIARQAVRESLVLMKNKDQLLPLNPKQRFLITGDGADNIGKQSGGWSVTWQGTNNTNDDFPGGSSIYDGFKEQIEAAGGSIELSANGEFQQQPDVAIVVFGEEPYAEGHGDRESLEFQPGDKSSLALLQSLQEKGIPVVSVFITGRPLWINPELNASDAFVVAWLPGSEGDGVAEVLLQKADGSLQYDFTGKLSYSWPQSPYQTELNVHTESYDPLLAYGFGLSYGERNVLNDDLPVDFAPAEADPGGRMIFSGQARKPWQVELFDGNSSLLVNSNTHNLNGVAYRTVDRLVQEDAIQISTRGDLPSGVRLVSESRFREDMSSVIANNSSLQFLIKVNQKPTSKVSLVMNCEGFGDESGSCNFAADITEEIASLAVNDWQSVSIPAQCFQQQGVNFGKIVVPFELQTSGQFEFAITNIEFIPESKLADSAEAKELACRGTESLERSASL